MTGMRGNSGTMLGPLQLPLSLPIGGWPSPSTRPAGGGAEYSSNGPALRGSPWQRQLRTPNADSPPFKWTYRSPRSHKCRSSGSFFKPAAVSSSGSSLSLTPHPPASGQLPASPSTGSISYRPSECPGVTAPPRKPPRLRSGYISPRYAMATAPAARISQPARVPARVPALSQEQIDAKQHKLLEGMRRVTQRKQREAEIRAYKLAYNMIDVNRDGSIDPAEVLQLLKTTGNSVTVEKSFWEAFRELDTDQSNGLNFDEFTALLDRIRTARTSDHSTVDGSVASQAVNNKAGHGTDTARRPPTGSVFMAAVIEIQRQLVDVCSAIDDVRAGGLREMILDPDEDSRVRTEMGRGMLKSRHQRTLPRERAQVQVSLFEDVADLAVTATGGKANQKGHRLRQQRQELQQRLNNDVVTKTQLCIRSTYAKNGEDKLEDRYGTVDEEAISVLVDFLRMFDSTLRAINR